MIISVGRNLRVLTENLLLGRVYAIFKDKNQLTTAIIITMVLIFHRAEELSVHSCGLILLAESSSSLACCSGSWDNEFMSLQRLRCPVLLLCMQCCYSDFTIGQTQRCWVACQG